MGTFTDYILSNWHLLAGGGVLGFCVGIVTGLFGAGGGFIVTPILNIFMNVPMNIAVGTSSCQVLGASGFSLYHHYEKNMFGIRVALVMLIGIPLGAISGAYAVKRLSALPAIAFMGKELKSIDFILLLVFLVFLSLVSAWLIIDNFFLRHGREDDAGSHVGLLSSWRVPPMIRFRTIPSGDFSATILVFLGFFMGFLGGLLGIGGGVIIMPMLFYVVGQETKYATRTDMMLVFASGFFATVSHALENNINYILVAALVCGAFFGTKIGASVQKRVSGKSLRKYFSFIVLFAALMVLGKLIKMLF